MLDMKGRYVQLIRQMTHIHAPNIAESLRSHVLLHFTAMVKANWRDYLI